MPVQRYMPWLMAMLVVSVAGMAFGAALARVWLVTWSAAVFALWAIGVALTVNLPYWRGGFSAVPGPAEGTYAFRQNVRLMAAVYAWGALAMQILHTTALTGLRWQHGWQYALVMLLFALASFHIAQALGDPDARSREPWLAWATPMTIGTAIMAALGLVYLVLSGKLEARRADWAANLVFLFGALTLMVLAAATLRTHDKLMRHR